MAPVIDELGRRAIGRFKELAQMPDEAAHVTNNLYMTSLWALGMNNILVNANEWDCTRSQEKLYTGLLTAVARRLSANSGAPTIVIKKILSKLVSVSLQFDKAVDKWNWLDKIAATAVSLYDFEVDPDDELSAEMDNVRGAKVIVTMLLHEDGLPCIAAFLHTELVSAKEKCKI